MLAGPLQLPVVANHGLPHNPQEWAIWIGTTLVVGLVVYGLWGPCQAGATAAGC